MQVISSGIDWIFHRTPLTWFIQSYWRDEAFSILLARHSILDILILTARDYSPPGYYLLLKLWITMFGETEIATRSLSLLLYVLTVFVIVEYLIHILKLPQRVATLVGIVAGLLSPLLTYYAFETRGYTLLAACAIASTYALMLGKRRLYLLTMGLGLCTHYFMIWTLLAHVVMAVRRLTPWRLPHMVRILAPVWLGGMIWIGFVIYQHQYVSDGQFWVPRPTWADLWLAPAIVLTGYERTFGYMYDLTPLALLVWCLIGVLILRHRRLTHSDEALVWSTLLPIGASFALSLVSKQSIFLPRYLIVSAPCILLLCIQSVRELKRVYALILGAALCVFLLNYQSQQVFYRTKENLATPIRQVKLQTRPGDYLLVRSELDYHVAQLYWHTPGTVKIIGKTYEEIPNYVGKVLIPQDAIITTYPCRQSCEVYLLDQTRYIKHLPYL